MNQEKVPQTEAKTNNFSSETRQNDLMSELHDALQYRSDALMSLYDRGMNIDQTDFEGRTALMLMSARGKAETVKKLLERGANVNAVFYYHDSIPNTALDAANEGKNKEVIELLKAAGAKTAKELGLQRK
jgi:ankyrin repeat protein